MNIIKRSLTVGGFPDNLKNARVTPISKEGDKCNLCNYWQISVLTVFSKAFEAIAYMQLYDYLENNSFLHKQHHGFRAKKFTTQAVLYFLQYLYKHVDSGTDVFSLFLDFRNAFDCVNHEILLSKLNTYGIRGITLDFFRTYLTNREQYVCIVNYVWINGIHPPVELTMWTMHELMASTLLWLSMWTMYQLMASTLLWSRPCELCMN